MEQVIKFFLRREPGAEHVTCAGIVFFKTDSACFFITIIIIYIFFFYGFYSFFGFAGTQTGDMVIRAKREYLRSRGRDYDARGSDEEYIHIVS